ncbi:MAG: TIR domain-containing protein [Pseudomonadota bacterium]
MKSTHPTVFISYSHDTEKHKTWVRCLAERLMESGIDVLLDQFDVALGSNLPLFMEKGLTESDRVIVVCTDIYNERANRGAGGAGYEKMIASAALYQNQESRKFIPIVRSVISDNKLPTFMAGRLYEDFSNENDFDHAFERLARDILNSPSLKKPALGVNPFDSSPPENQPKTFSYWPIFFDAPLLDHCYTNEDVRPVSFSPDGRRLASGTKANARLWDAVTGKHLAYIGRGHSSQINDIVFDSQGRWVFSAADGETISGHETKEPYRHTLCLTEVGTHPCAIVILDTSPPMLVGATSSTLYFFQDIPRRFDNYDKRFDTKNMDALKENYRLDGIGDHERFIRLLMGSASENIVAVTKDGWLFEVDVKTAVIERSTHIPGCRVFDACKYNDSIFLICMSSEGGPSTSVLYQLEMLTFSFSLSNQFTLQFGETPRALAITDSVNVLLVLTNQRLLRLLDDTHELIDLRKYGLKSAKPNLRSIDAHGSRIMIGRGNGSFLFFNLTKPYEASAALNFNTLALEFCSTEAKMIIHNDENSMIWDTHLDSCLANVTNHSHQLNQIIFDQKRTRYIDGTSHIYDVASSKALVDLEDFRSSSDRFRSIPLGFCGIDDAVWGTVADIDQSDALFRANVCRMPAYDGRKTHLFRWNTKGQIVGDAIFQDHIIAERNQHLLGRKTTSIIALVQREGISLIDSDDFTLNEIIETPFPITCLGWFQTGIVVGDCKGTVRVVDKDDNEISAYHIDDNAEIIEVTTDFYAKNIIFKFKRSDRGFVPSIGVFSRHLNRMMNLQWNKPYKDMLMGAWLSPSGNFILVAFGGWDKSEQILSVLDTMSERPIWTISIQDKPITRGIFVSDNEFYVILTSRLAHFIRREGYWDDCTSGENAILALSESKRINKTAYDDETKHWMDNNLTWLDDDREATCQYQISIRDLRLF